MPILFVAFTPLLLLAVTILGLFTWVFVLVLVGVVGEAVSNRSKSATLLLVSAELVPFTGVVVLFEETFEGLINLGAIFSKGFLLTY